jgi:integrase
MLMLRASNLVSMRWEWVKPGNTVWRYGYLDIPASEMKSRRDFQLPLTKQAKDRLDAIRALGLSDTFVFPNPHCRSGHYRHEWMTKAFEDLKLKDGSNLHEHTTAHGLARKTTISYLDSLAVGNRLITPLLLGHAEQSASEELHNTYSKADYAPERLALMEDLHEWLEQCQKPLKKPVMLKKRGHALLSTS